MKDVFVTKPYVPPLFSYISQLKKIWKSRRFSNNGPLTIELENKIKDLIGAKHVFFVTNGTIAIQMSLQALGISKQVITTPFSFVATVNSLLWEKCKPIFVDIDPHTLTLNPRLIEAAITPDTQAILAVHVYGYPCDVKAIEHIARKYNLKVIYDAAHSFNTYLHQESVLNYGDISTLSFHATKIFHTVEGGAIVTNNDEVAEKIKLLRSFGGSDAHFTTLGINGKNSELHAAMGLCNLNNIDLIRAKRKSIYHFYLKKLKPLSVSFPQIPEYFHYNYIYFPILFETEEELLAIKYALEKKRIYCRRYFYPALNTLPHVKMVTDSLCPVAESIASRVLCLPLYHDLPIHVVHMITKTLKELLLRKAPSPVVTSVGVAQNVYKSADISL
ncbi:DegT/DnrJ/EryC1/StrS family aminotransferase [Candidatus Roizmanbacteria bacterium]|nr:DegT/DnrJ/EryC1/StrS family aminotransferase [Candidatus Roizmanbacteria bacterium]